MSDVRNDLPLTKIREAAEKVAHEARRKAFEVGSTVVYARDGKIVRESSDGKTVIVGNSKAEEVKVRKLVWKLG